MRTKKMKKYSVIYEVEIEAKDMIEAQEIAERRETKDKARLKRIEGKDESWERFYDSE